MAIAVQPTLINELCQQLSEMGSKSIYSTDNKEKIENILLSLSKGEFTHFDMPHNYFLYVYQIALKCSEKEYKLLKKAFEYRVTPQMFEIGLEMFMRFPENDRIEELFGISCRLVCELRPRVFAKTIFSKCNFPIKNIFSKFYNIVSEENLSITDLLNKYKIEKESAFAQCLFLSYAAHCKDKEFIKVAEDLPPAIMNRGLDFVKPAIKNYIQSIEFEKMPPEIIQAVYERLMTEDSNETLGMDKKSLENIRSVKFRKIFYELFKVETPKYRAYCQLSGSVSRVNMLENGYFSIEFGRYIVLDCKEWHSKAYAFTADVFRKQMENWKQEQFSVEFWENILSDSIPSAHDVILKLKSNPIIELDFEGFDKLYSKDVLTKL